MMSALECFHHAVRYEEEAEDTSDEGNKAALLEQAARWRKIGNQAKAQDADQKVELKATLG